MAERRRLAVHPMTEASANQDPARNTKECQELNTAMQEERPGGAPDPAGMIARILNGDQQQFATLMRLYNRALFRAARSILRNDQEAEDALQEAWLEAYRKLASFRGESSLSTWLTRIAINAALGRRRQQARRAEVISLWSDGEAAQQEEVMKAVDPHMSPELETMRGEMRVVLEHAIDALPEQFRTVFILRALEEMASEEVAAVLGIPEATARSRFFRARAMLREMLAREVDLAEGEAFGFAGERCARITRRVMKALAEEAQAIPPQST